MMKPSAMPKQRMKLKGTPVAMPKKNMTVGNPVAMPKKKSAKPKGLNDFLKEGKRPPSKNKKGILSSPDVIIKGYNDKKTLSRKKK
jgi:hypothetical protein